MQEELWVKITAVFTIVLVVIGYLTLAASIHLAPFSSNAASLPVSGPTGGSPSPNPSPDPSSSSSQLHPAVDLLSLIPSSIQAGNCVKVPPAFSAISEYECSSMPNVPAGNLSYYLFASASALSAAYFDDILKGQANVQAGSGQCTVNYRFVSYAAPCEAEYSNSSPGVNGHLVEYPYKGFDTVTWTDDQQLVLVFMSGENGNAMVSWWQQNPPQWIVSGS